MRHSVAVVKSGTSIFPEGLSCSSPNVNRALSMFDSLSTIGLSLAAVSQVLPGLSSKATLSVCVRIETRCPLGCFLFEPEML